MFAFAFFLSYPRLAALSSRTWFLVGFMSLVFLYVFTPIPFVSCLFFFFFSFGAGRHGKWEGYLFCVSDAVFFLLC